MERSAELQWNPSSHTNVCGSVLFYSWLEACSVKAVWVRTHTGLFVQILLVSLCASVSNYNWSHFSQCSFICFFGSSITLVLLYVWIYSKHHILLLDTSPSSLAPQSQCVSRLCLPELMTIRPDCLGLQRTWTTRSKELSLGLTAPGVPPLSLSQIDGSVESEKERRENERSERWRYTDRGCKTEMDEKKGNDGCKCKREGGEKTNKKPQSKYYNK